MVLILIEMLMEYAFAILDSPTMVECVQNAHQVHSLAPKLINVSMSVVKIQSTLNLLQPVYATLDTVSMEVHAKLVLMTTSSLMVTVLLAQLIPFTMALRKVVSV